MATLRSELRVLSTPLSRPVGNARSTWLARESLLFSALSEEGNEGQGEAAPLPDYSPDGFAETRRFLEGLRLFPEDELSLERVRLFVAGIPETLPAARFAVETALLDLLAQESGLSLSELLGADAVSAARCGLLNGDEPIVSARALAARGIHVAKLKVGRAWPEELEAIQKLRAHFPELRLRLDANGSWSPNEAMRHIQDISSLGIEFVEQPVAPAKMPTLIGSPVPLAADESMHSAMGRELLEPMLKSQTLVALVLKPTVLGGLFACMAHARWARDHGLAAVASHCFEGPVATAAVAELAIATRGRFAAGLDLHPGLALGPHSPVPQLANPGIHRHRPGLGVRVDP